MRVQERSLQPGTLGFCRTIALPHNNLQLLQAIQSSLHCVRPHSIKHLRCDKHLVGRTLATLWGNTDRNRGEQIGHLGKRAGAGGENSRAEPNCKHVEAKI